MPAEPVPACANPRSRAATIGRAAGAATSVLLAFAGLAPERARACSCAPDAISSSEPAADATDVPIDVAPIVQGYLDPATVAFEHEDGTPVEFAIRSGQGLDLCAGVTAELVPQSALAAQTTYVIRARPPVEGELESELRFTTGSATVEEQPLAAPEVTLSFVRGNLIVDSCVGEVRGCLDVGDAEQAELRVIRDEQELIWTFVRGTVELNTLNDVAPDCIEVRARDAAGRRSDATTVCAGDYPIRDTVADDYESHQLRCERGVIGDGQQPPEDASDAGSDAAAPAPEPEDTEPPADAGAPDETERNDAGRNDAGRRTTSRVEVDMTEGGCAAAGAGSQPGAHALPWLVLLLLHGRKRYRNV